MSWCVLPSLIFTSMEKLLELYQVPAIRSVAVGLDFCNALESVVACFQVVPEASVMLRLA